MSVERLIRLDNRLGRLSVRARLLITLAAVAAVTLLRWLFHDWLGLLPFLPYFPVVVVSSALFGARYGYLVALLALPLAIYLFVPPQLSFDVGTAAWLAGALFVLALVFIAWTVGTLRRFALRLHRAERARAVLLSEMNHRVRNNLQMVSALLMLESARFTDPTVRRVLDEAVGRVGVIGQIHALLHQGNSASEVSADEFLARLCDGLRATFIGPRPITLHVRAHPLVLTADRAVAVGLVVNEAVTNALRHGFPPGCKGGVWVELSVEEHHAVLAVSDDGAGIDGSLPKGLGGRIIDMMAHQLAGTAIISERAGGGTVLRLTFPLT